MLSFFEWLAERFARAANDGLTRGTERFLAKATEGELGQQIQAVLPAENGQKRLPAEKSLATTRGRKRQTARK